MQHCHFAFFFFFKFGFQYTKLGRCCRNRLLLLKNARQGFPTMIVYRKHLRLINKNLMSRLLRFRQRQPILRLFFFRNHFKQIPISNIMGQKYDLSAVLLLLYFPPIKNEEITRDTCLNFFFFSSLLMFSILRIWLNKCAELNIQKHFVVQVFSSFK